MDTKLFLSEATFYTIFSRWKARPTKNKVSRPFGPPYSCGQAHAKCRFRVATSPKRSVLASFFCYQGFRLCGGRSNGKHNSTAWHASSFGMLCPLTLHMLDLLHSHGNLSGLSLGNFLVALAEHVSIQLGRQSHTQPPKHKPANLLFTPKCRASRDPAAGAGGVTGNAVPPLHAASVSTTYCGALHMLTKARTNVSCPPRPATCK